MHKQQFIEQLRTLKFNPVGVRACADANYGLDKQTYSVWICGRGSIDPALPTGLDLSFVGRFHKEETANSAAVKYQKWFEKYQQQEEA